MDLRWTLALLAIPLVVAAAPDVVAKEPLRVEFLIGSYICRTRPIEVGDTSMPLGVALSATLREAVLSGIARDSARWTEVPLAVAQRFERAVKISCDTNECRLDALPYAVWDMCSGKQFRYLAVFYVYHDNDKAVTHQANAYMPHIQIRQEIDKRTYDGLSDEDITFYFNVFDLVKNRSVLAYDEDIDNLLRDTGEGEPKVAAAEFVRRSLERLAENPLSGRR
jgi:hypothetical protein